MLKSCHNNKRNRPTTRKHSASPLRQRMIEDMTMRNLSKKTQSAYISRPTRPTQIHGAKIVDRVITGTASIPHDLRQSPAIHRTSRHRGVFCRWSIGSNRSPDFGILQLPTRTMPCRIRFHVVTTLFGHSQFGPATTLGAINRE